MRNQKKKKKKHEKVTLTKPCAAVDDLHHADSVFHLKEEFERFTAMNFKSHGGFVLRAVIHVPWFFLFFFSIPGKWICGNFCNYFPLWQTEFDLSRWRLKLLLTSGEKNFTYSSDSLRFQTGTIEFHFCSFIFFFMLNIIGLTTVGAKVAAESESIFDP